MKEKIFIKRIITRGSLSSTFVFENDQEVERWLAEDLPELEEEYGQVSLTFGDLPGLRVGDKCQVLGEGLDVFTIKKLIKYSKDRYGFILDTGWAEEVGKCYSVEEEL